MDFDMGRIARVHQKGTLVEVEHVKAHRSKKEMQQMSLFEKFITKGNEKAEEPAKKRSDAGWRRYGACESYHDSAGTGGGSGSMAVCN